MGEVTFEFDLWLRRVALEWLVALHAGDDAACMKSGHPKTWRAGSFNGAIPMLLFDCVDAAPLAPTFESLTYSHIWGWLSTWHPSTDPFLLISRGLAGPSNKLVCPCQPAPSPSSNWRRPNPDRLYGSRALWWFLWAEDDGLRQDVDTLMSTSM
jgi:hypothetical protein